MKFRVTLTYEYEVSMEDAQEYYETTDLAEMAEIDRDNMQRSTRCIVDDLDVQKVAYQVAVTPVPEA